MATNRAEIPYSGYASDGLQVFTPTRIDVIAAGNSLDTTDVSCIRVSAPTDYLLNDTGETGVMPIGCTGIDDNITSLQFPNGAVVEVMTTK
jgi:hypothetical protein